MDMHPKASDAALGNSTYVTFFPGRHKQSAHLYPDGLITELALQDGCQSSDACGAAHSSQFDHHYLQLPRGPQECPHLVGLARWVFNSTSPNASVMCYKKILRGLEDAQGYGDSCGGGLVHRPSWV